MSIDKRTGNGAAERFGIARNFPREAYDYSGDITPQDVAIIRNLAKDAIDAEEWDVIDGFKTCAQN